MSTGIQWTDETWNPVVGCEQVSPGCAHCYAKTLHDRRHAAQLAGKPQAPQYAMPFEMVQCRPERLNRPLHWRKPRRVFVNSVSDLFHEDVPFHFIRSVFLRMQETPRHTFQILTKRPARMREFILEEWPGGTLSNVWLGVSVENQRWFERALTLAMTPSAVRFLSVEPLLGPVDLAIPDPSLGHRSPIECLQWVIAGGESGLNARPMQMDWARSLRDQCGDAGVPFFFKQWGGRTPKSGGRELDGRTWDEFPTAMVPA